MRAAPFLQVAEVWVPNAAGTHLRLTAGSYGPHIEFREISRGRVFARGEGLPGRIWDGGQPTVLNHFRGGSGFLRAEAAARCGLAAGMGLPFFRNGQVCAVVVLLCASPDIAPGAFEVWQPTPDKNELRLQSGYYGAFDGFRRVSSAVRFAPGEGLPGRAWKNQFPEMLSDVSHSDSFVRAAAAVTYDLATGLAFPVASDDTVEALLVTLSARTTPMARAIEVWKPSEQARTLVLHAAGYEDAEGLQLPLGTTTDFGVGLVGRAWSEGFPQVLNEPADLGIARAEAAVRTEVAGGIALPVLIGNRVRAVVSLVS